MKRAATRVALVLAMLGDGPSCTTRDTGSIDLFAGEPSASAGPTPPPMPAKPCVDDASCPPGKPMPAKPAEACTSDVDCTGAAPRRARCDLEKGRCMDCRPDDPACADAAALPPAPPSSP